jgi:exopolysaccharide biosynthesis polyprenyl glycosylphosphotransferase
MTALAPPPPTADADAPIARAMNAAVGDRRGPFRPKRLSPTRRRVHPGDLKRLYRLIDALAVALAAAVGCAVALPRGMWANPISEAAPFVFGAILIVGALAVAGAYRLRPREGLIEHFGRLSGALVGCGLMLTMYELGTRPAPDMRFGLIDAYGLAAIMILGLHLGWRAHVGRLRRDGRLTPNIVVVGATPNALKLIAHAMRTRQAAVLGVFDDRRDRGPERLMGVPMLGGASDLIGHRIMPYVDLVVITVPARAQARVRDLVRRLSVLPNEITLFLEGDQAGNGDVALSRILDAPLTRVSGHRVRRGKAAAKRAQDLVLGGLALLLVSPIMLAVAVAIRLDTPGPIFFRQRRQGFNNEDIVVWKFRSMHHDQRDERGAHQTEAKDPRVTRVGRLIRGTSLDELPQLFNVLAGEMSLVGPRPHSPHMRTGDVDSAGLVADYAHRHRLKPGMTGWAVIHGSLGPLHTKEDVRRRVALDVEYIERQSFWLDLYIMLMTVPRLLSAGHEAR